MKIHTETEIELSAEELKMVAEVIANLLSQSRVELPQRSVSAVRVIGICANCGQEKNLRPNGICEECVRGLS